jgi:trk system potassium uptake protein TrkH
MKAHTKKAMQPSRYLMVGFFIIIMAGSVLLALPVTHRPGVTLSYIDALFTAVSAVCVTGLVTVDIALSFNLFGRIVIALLIMAGGMGFAGMIVSIALFMGWEVGISQRNMLSEAYNLGTLSGTLRIVKTVILASLIFQLLGTVAGYWVFRPHYQPLAAWGHSLFHSISAFNNAGFDLMGNFQSMMDYRHNILLNVVTMFLIVSGGIGFFVLADLLRKRFMWNKFTMHTKIVVSVTLFLILLGTVIFLLVERLDFLSALFLSITARTAGFNTVNTQALSQGTLFFVIILMFIGASPGSTGGGIKTTTTFAILLSLFSLASRRQPAAFRRRISDESITKAYQVLLLALLVVFSGTFIMIVVEDSHFSFLQVLFESVSAFATVGLSTGITPQLTLISKIVLMLTMFIGRLGPITIATSLSAKESVLKHIEERVFIG